MRKCLALLPALLAATSLLLLACQAPAPATPVAPAESSADVEPAQPEPTATELPVAPTDTASPAPAGEPAVTAAASSPVGETQAAEPPDPITADPNRPGFTMDGSPSLGDPNAAIVIVDFSDFQ